MSKADFDGGRNGAAMPRRHETSLGAPSRAPSDYRDGYNIPVSGRINHTGVPRSHQRDGGHQVQGEGSMIFDLSHTPHAHTPAPGALAETSMQNAAAPRGRSGSVYSGVGDTL